MTAPKLRFKEFDATLNQTTFNEYILSSKYGPRFDANDYDVNGNVKTIRGTDVTLNATIKYDQVPIANLPIKLIEEHQLKTGDILMITTADCGLSAVFEEQDIPFIASAYAVRISLKESMNSIWSKYYLQTQHIINEVNKYVRKGTLSNLPLSDISKFNVTVPSKEEQTKIASFLSQVDEKISQLTQKHELLSQYKQGMMQKLFSQQIRFKADDGSEFGEWENLKIFDLAKDKTLNNGVFNDQNKVGKGYKLINVLDMYINRDIDELRLKLLDLSAKEFEKNKVYYGDIFFTRSSLVKEGIAFSNVYLGNSNDVTYDGHLIKLSPDLDRVNPIFLNYVLKTNAVRKQLIKGGKTATMTTIGQQEVGNTIVSLPCLTEQIKIASFLSVIDQKIEVVTQQIEQAKTWKKGLLQQMFV